MKANEFVKKFGWGLAKQYLNRTKNQGVYIEPKIKLMIHQSVCEPTTSGIDFVFHRDDLKRLVESHELVERVISRHNKSSKECQIDINGLKSFVKKNPKIYSKRLKRAIADVESCQ